VSKEDELLRPILKDPDADEPRIEYARWAKAAGNPRGEFIELQVEEARIHRKHTYAAEWLPFFSRAQAMLKLGDTLWLVPLQHLIDEGVLKDPTFYRGFVEHVEMDARVFAEKAPLVYALAPIRHLTLTNVMAYPQALASPHLGRIGTLVLSSQDLDDSAIELLAREGHTRRLRWLDLAINRITARGVEAIAASPNLKGLKFLELRGNPVDDPVDRWTYEGEAIVWTEPRDIGKALEERHGPLEWLHAPYNFGVAFPPLRQDAIDS